MKNIAIIFAGGIGQRLNQKNDVPKQFINVLGKPIIIHTLNVFQNHPKIDKIYMAILPEYIEYMKKLAEEHSITKLCGITEGGETGQDSIYNALKLAQSENPDDSVVLIHDGVRPILTEEVITENIVSTMKHGNAITCTSCHETILVSNNGINPQHVPFRSHTYKAQAPQSFKLNEIIEAHDILRAIPRRYENMIDSCTIFNFLGKPTYMVQGNQGNIKVTTSEDIYILQALIQFLTDKKNNELMHDIQPCEVLK